MSQGPNALRALDALGVGDRARENGTPFYGTANLRELSGRDLNRATPEQALPLLGCHRADLHRILLEALPDNAICTGANATGYDRTPSGPAIRLGDETLEAALVVSADGVHSTARRSFSRNPGSRVLALHRLARHRRPRSRPRGRRHDPGQELLTYSLSVCRGLGCGRFRR